ncbi:amino acid deaminase/aldolase [Nesterenkonia marinintestina]|uniref:amino acid deaminase/aldolase n=1 Tax=Nesterenkonia marinintestina TaxID=2979865 RepID=UPI0021C12FA8|nr:amino acid deaminase/aldolase [Nesterenkonia sp. GX14115]
MSIEADDRWAMLSRAAAHLDAPAAVLDLDAFDANAEDLVARADGLPIRVASKSVRCREMLRRVLARPGFSGVLAYTLGEAIWLVRTGTCDDVVVGYPTAEPGALAQLCRDPQLAGAVTLMIDSPEQLDLVDAVVPPHRRPDLRVSLDLDCSLRLGPAVLGARRSPVRTPEQAEAAAEHIVARPGFRLVGVMGYEAQIAGVADRRRTGPAARPGELIVRGMKALSVRDLRTRRPAMVEAVRRRADLEFVNGGGTGSLESTGAGGECTELAAGSGLYGSHLFDGYRGFRPRPAAAFCLRVVRRPAHDVVTVQGGGWIASGAVGSDRQPLPVSPPGMRLMPAEGAGEVQTPLRCTAEVPRIGDLTWWRHAKAGELCEHVDELHLFHDGRLVGAVPTYRGESQVFL